MKPTPTTIWSRRLPPQRKMLKNRTCHKDASTCCSQDKASWRLTDWHSPPPILNWIVLWTPSKSYTEVSVWWCSRFRSTIFAKILASIGAVADAAAARRTRGAPVFCKRPTWWNACRPPGTVNCRREVTAMEEFTMVSKVWPLSPYSERGNCIEILC